MSCLAPRHALTLFPHHLPGPGLLAMNRWPLALQALPIDGTSVRVPPEAAPRTRWPLAGAGP